MIDFDGEVVLEEKDMLPAGPGIYFVCDSDGNVLYVGRSVNMRNRWLRHHRYNQAKSIEQVVIKWKQYDPEDLDLKEAYFIETLTPQWNRTFIQTSPKVRRENKPGLQQTSIYLDQIDREAIEIIKAHFGVSTNSDAIRLAVRKVARQIASMEKQVKDG